MIADLPRIATLGFNTIWVNPLQLTGKFIIEKQGQPLKGSLYAMADDRELNPDFFPPGMLNKDREALLRQYVATAKSHGLSPIFDLVLRHVSRDVCSVPVASATNDFQQRCSSYLIAPEENRWQDVAAFRIGKVEVTYLMQQIFKPFIERYIGDYGRIKRP